MVRRTAIAVLGALLLAAPAWSYVVYLKDGSQIIAREKYRVEGDIALVVLRSGVTSSIPLAEIDVERCERENTIDLGTARKIEGLEKIDEIDAPPPPPPEKRETIADLLRDRESTDGGPGSGLTLPEPRRARPEADPAERLPRTKAGYVDLLKLPRQRHEDVDLAAAVRDYLRGQGLSLVEVFQGSDERHLLLEIVANAEPLVFQALTESANALLQIREQFPDRLDSFELLLLADTSDRPGRAGQFLLAPEHAEMLATGAISPASFFLRYVEF